MGMSIEEAVEYLSTPEGAAMSAAWFWSKNGLNEIADRGDVVAATKRINGGTIGLADRQAHYSEALHIFV
jgi:putative chitinase